MKSLHTFCKEYDLPKTSVRRFLLGRGFNTSEGLTEQAIASALQEFKPEALAAKDEEGEAVTPDEVLPAGALGHYLGGSGNLATTASSRGMTLGDLAPRLQTRNERRQAVAAGFQGISLTREERRALIEQAALVDADDDAETYASVYQQRLDRNLQRHAIASVAVLGKDVEDLEPAAAG